jgi:hypothetical protein
MYPPPPLVAEAAEERVTMAPSELLPPTLLEDGSGTDKNGEEGSGAIMFFKSVRSSRAVDGLNRPPFYTKDTHIRINKQNILAF